MKVSRNAPCPCGSGKKYKNCCLPKERTLSVQPSNKREVIDWHLEGYEDSDEAIEGLFARTISSTSEHRRDDLTKKLHDCKHKLYAVRYHLKAIKREIDERIADFKEQYEAMSGAGCEQWNPVLIYETEAFLFQVKSNVDLMIQALGSVVPSLKNFDTFKHKGTPGKLGYVAGGKVIKELEKSGKCELARLFDSQRQEWIQQMTLWRTTITHYSGLRDFHCFVEEPYRGGDQVNIYYPTMPSGERVDVYCQAVYHRLCELYQSVLTHIEQSVAQIPTN